MDAAAEIASARTSWEDTTGAESESYGEVLRELSDRGLEPGRYVEAKAELVRLQAAAPRLDAQTTAIVRPVRTNDRSHVLEVTRAHITGQRTQITAAIAAPDFFLRTFADAIRAGVHSLQPHRIRGAQATALTSVGEPLPASWRN